MNHHVPFETRHREVVYINDPPRKKTNGLGVAGFILSIFALLTCGVLSPIALIVSFFGLFRSPRGFAFAGTIISLLGTLMLITWFAGEIIEENIASQRAIRAREQAVTRDKLVHAQKAIQQYRDENGSRLPEPIEGNKLVIQVKDAWGNELRYEPEERKYTIRSAGPDRKWDTDDDLVRAESYYRPPETEEAAEAESPSVPSP